MRGRKLLGDEGGQSLIETALVLPLMLVLVFNAVNIGYYFFAALNLTTAPRLGAQYSILGRTSTLGTALPSSGDVSSLVYLSINGAMTRTANTPTQICSLSVGISGSGSSQVASCNQYHGFSSTAPDPDPEGPILVLNRVDIQYQLAPIIPGAWFNVVPAPNIHRFIEMRAVN